MPRGFTLLEMLITVVVLGVVLAFVAPDYSSQMEKEKVRRLAPEVHNFFMLARSEAVMQNKTLYIHLLVNGSAVTNNATGDWKISLTDSATAGAGTEYLQHVGAGLDEVALNFNLPGSGPSSKYFEVEGVRGRINDGNITIHPSNSSSEFLKIVSSQTTGRLMICSADPDPNSRNSIGLYGYEICPS